MEFVSWDDDILNIWKNKINVPNHQPGYYQCFWQTQQIGFYLESGPNFMKPSFFMGIMAMIGLGPKLPTSFLYHVNWDHWVLGVAAKCRGFCINTKTQYVSSIKSLGP